MRPTLSLTSPPQGTKGVATSLGLQGPVVSLDYPARKSDFQYAMGTAVCHEEITSRNRDVCGGFDCLNTAISPPKYPYFPHKMYFFECHTSPYGVMPPNDKKLSSNCVEVRRLPKVFAHQHLGLASWLSTVLYGIPLKCLKRVGVFPKKI